MQILLLDVSGNHVAYHSEFALVDYDSIDSLITSISFIYSQLNSSNMKNKRYSKGIIYYQRSFMCKSQPSILADYNFLYDNYGARVFVSS